MASSKEPVAIQPLDKVISVTDPGDDQERDHPVVAIPIDLKNMQELPGLPGPTRLESELTTEDIQTKTGRSKSLNEWDYFASDRTHLSDTLTFNYIVQWILGVIIAIGYVFLVEYGLLKLLNIHFCDITNNTNYNNWTLPFLSIESWKYTIQQIFALLLGYGGFWMFHAVEIIGVEPEKLRKRRIILWICGLVLFLCAFIFVIPLDLTWSAIVSSFGAAVFFILFGLIYNGIDGMRRISIWVLATLLFSVFHRFIAELVLINLPENWFGVVYPFYLTIFETVLFFLISIIDIPQCCRCKSCCDGRLHTDNHSTPLGAIYFWHDRDLYVFVASINVFVETWRISSFVLMQHNLTALVLNFLVSIVSEIFTRNNLYYEIIYRVIWRTSAPPLTRVYSIYLGCKLHTEYIPILIMLGCNLLGFGYTADCYLQRVGLNMDISNAYWMIAVLFGLAFMCDVCGHWSNKLFVKVLKIFEKTDEARRVKYVKLKMRDIILAAMHLSFVAIQAFSLDASARRLQ